MRIRHIKYIVLAVLLSLSVAPASNAAWGTAASKDSSLSLFAATSSDANGSGYGIALDRYGKQLTDISLVSLDSVRVIQSASLTPKTIGVIPVYIGFVGGYADAISPSATVSSGFVSGLQVIITKSRPSSGVSFDLRVSSLSKSINPIKWISDPDILWAGAGVSFSF